MSSSSSAAVQIIADTPELSVIAGAAAQIPCQKCPNFLVGGVGIFPEQGDGIHHKAGIAEAALIRALIGDKADKVGGFP